VAAETCVPPGNYRQISLSQQRGISIGIHDTRIVISKIGGRIPEVAYSLVTTSRAKRYLGDLGSCGNVLRHARSTSTDVDTVPLRIRAPGANRKRVFLSKTAAAAILKSVFNDT